MPDKDPDCPDCAERAKAWSSRPKSSLDFVYCPMCDGGATCRFTKADCDGRVRHAVRRDDGGSLVEDIGFPCQEPVTRVMQLVQKLVVPKTSLPPDPVAAP